MRGIASAIVIVSVVCRHVRVVRDERAVARGIVRRAARIGTDDMAHVAGGEAATANGVNATIGGNIQLFQHETAHGSGGICCAGLGIAREGIAEKDSEAFLPLVRSSVNTLQGGKCSGSYWQFGVVAVGFEAKRDRLAACAVPVGRAFILFVLRVVATGEHIRFPGIAGWYGCLIC